MRILNRALEIFFRFLLPILGILLFFIVLCFAVIGINTFESDSRFLVTVIILASIAVVLSITLLLLANHKRFRGQWRDWERDWYGNRTDDGDDSAP